MAIINHTEGYECTKSIAIKLLSPTLPITGTFLLKRSYLLKPDSRELNYYILHIIDIDTEYPFNLLERNFA